MESSGPGGRSYREGFIIQRELSHRTYLHKSLRKLAEGHPGESKKVPGPGKSCGASDRPTPWGWDKVTQGGWTSASAEPALKRGQGGWKDRDRPLARLNQNRRRWKPIPGAKKGEMQDSPLDRTLPPKGQRPRKEARVGGRW